MLASKSNPDGPTFDTFNCLRCEFIMTTAPWRAEPQLDQ